MTASILAPRPLSEVPNWRAQVRVDKYDGDVDAFRARVGTDFADVAAAEAAFLAAHAPVESIEREGNILVNAGISLLEDLLIGAGGTAYNNANAYLGVGDSSTSASASQTDLQAASNKTRVGMDATYPSRSSQTLTFRSTFGAGSANYAWNEWAIFNASSGGTMLNRKAESLGTKSGGSWVLTVTLTLS